MGAKDGGLDVAGQIGSGGGHDAPHAAVGTTVGKYDVLKEIGRGGMGVVFLARQRGLERFVALKALHGATGLASRAGEALVKESRLAGSLSHPNIVTVYEYLEEAGTPYIAMEYVSWGSLRAWIGCMSLAQLAGVLEELLAGLAAVAPSGIVHRDLKPENVMVTADGRVKITDFGIAKATQRAGTYGITATPAGMTVGTPAYMAPEQALGEEVGPWTDLYSVGIMAYEHLVGHIPFRDAVTPIAMLLRHVKDPVPAPAEVDNRVDLGLSDWVSRLLVKDPTRRTQSARTAWEELEEIVIGRLGPMWRREARLTERARSRLVPRRLIPAQFASQIIPVHALTAVEPSSLTATPPVERTRDVPTRVDDQHAVEPLRMPRISPRSLAGVVVIATLAGFGISRGISVGRSSQAHRMSAGTLSVFLPPGWGRSSLDAAVPSYHFKAPLTVETADRSGALTLGLTTATSAALLPSGLIAQEHVAPKREAIKLGRVEFFRYRAATLNGTGEAAAIYTSPTSSGTLVGVCRSPGGGASVSVGCEQILGSVTLASGHGFELPRSASYASALTRIIDAFDGEWTRLATQFSQAASPSAQARAASLLQRASRQAASSLRSAGPGPSEAPVNLVLVHAIERMAVGYAEIAGGVRDQNAAGFRAGAGAVRGASGVLRATLSKLATAG